MHSICFQIYECIYVYIYINPCTLCNRSIKWNFFVFKVLLNEAIITLIHSISALIFSMHFIFSSNFYMQLHCLQWEVSSFYQFKQE